MNKKLNNNFSLRKLLLTALIAGPLATLPAPLWALPDSGDANLTKSAGVTATPVGTTQLNINATQNNAILTWQAFGSGTSPINSGDVINYFLPNASSSILNSVAGGVATTISGSIQSNGNVYLLNPAGIVIGATAQINTGGFYASTVPEPSSFFSINGTLSYLGTATSNVTVNGTGTTSGVDAATIQAIGSGNNIYLAGNAVDIQGGKFFGNLFVRSQSTTNPLLLTNVSDPNTNSSVAFAKTGPVSINLVGSPLVGGGLNITTNGGNVRLTGGVQATASLTNVATTATVAAANVTLTGSGVTGLVPTVAGAGYVTAPTVTISGGGGTGALATTTITNGVVTAINVVAPGTGYTATPTITLSAAQGVAGVATITNAGSGYQLNPSVTVGAPGSGVNLSTSITAGALTGLNVLTTGTGITAAPTVTISAPTLNTLTIAPNVSSTPGAVVINTSGTSVNGNIVQGASAFTANTTGSLVTLNAGTGTTAGNVLLKNVDFLTVGATANNITITDNSGGLTLNGSTAATNLTIATNSTILQGSGTQSVGGIVTLTPATGSTVSFTGSGNITLANLTSATTTISTSGGDLTLGDVAAGNALSLTSTGGQITAGNITTTSTLTISATTAGLGKLTATKVVSATGTITVAGDISLSNGSAQAANGTSVSLQNTGGSTLSVTSSAGNITLGGISASSTLNLTATVGTISQAGIFQTNTLTVTAAAGTVSTGNLSTANTSVINSNSITTGTINTNSSSLAITASTGAISTGNITTNSTLTLSAPAATGTITTGTINSTTTRTVTLSSGGSIDLKTITAPVLSVTSTTGSITQSGVITSTSSATFNALGDISLHQLSGGSTTALNDFNSIVLVGGGGGTSGIQVTDINDITIGSGTAALGATAITSGVNMASYVAPTVTLGGAPTMPGTFVVTVNTSTGQVTGIANSIAGVGLTSAPTITIAAPVGGLTGVTPVAATAIANLNAAGSVTGWTITNPGAGYSAGNTAVTVTADTRGTAASVAGTFSNGVLSGLTVTPGTAPYASAPGVTITGGTGARATTAVDAAGVISVGSFSNSGGIAIGAAAVDVISFGSTLSLTTKGATAAGGATSNYSLISTNANNVRVFGNITVNTNNTNATIGSNTFGNASNYSFGQIGGTVGTAILSVYENQTLNLGAITAGSLDARSIGADIVNTGKLTITGGNAGFVTQFGGNAVFSANTLFNPGNITLNNSFNAITGTAVIGNAKDFALTNNGTTAVQAGSPGINGKAATGNTNVTVLGTSNLTLTAASGGDYTTVGFTANGGNVSVTDSNGLTLQNLSNSGAAATVTVNSAGPVILGSGIALGSNGLTTINSTTSTASITDSAPNVRIFGPVNFSSDNSIAITNAGHSFGAVGLVTTGATSVANGGTSNITYTEGGTANLANVSVGTVAVPGSLTVVSSGGNVQQAAGATILVPVSSNSTNTVSFTSVNGAVNLSNAGNAIAPALNLTAVGNSSVNQSTANNLVLGNIAVSAGTFAASATNVAANTITQSAGSSAKIYGATTFSTQGGKITVTNTGNNFGGITATSTNGLAAGADIAITEAGTLNFLSVNSGTGGNLAAISENAGVIQSGTGGLTVGGATTLTAAAAGITLNTGTTSNTFGGGANKGILVTTAGNVSIQDAALTTILTGGTNIGGTLVLKNSNGSGQIKDSSTGTITIAGTVLFDTTTNALSSVNIGQNSLVYLGAVSFRSGTVNITEQTTLNMAQGSVASGNVTLSSVQDSIITSGNSTFQGSLTLIALKDVSVTNSIFVNSGLTVRALGTVNLSALSITGNLNNISPTVVPGFTSYPTANQPKP